MKTLREYIDQLDEISRRDFLKGAGAAAVAAAAGSAIAQQSRYSSEDVKTIIQGVELYFALSSREATTSKGVWGKDRTKSALDKIAKNPEGKKIIQDTWKKLRQQGLPDETDMDIFTGNKGGIATQRLQRLEQLVAFDESVNQGVAEDSLEEASPDAVKRIEELVKYK